MVKYPITIPHPSLILAQPPIIITLAILQPIRKLSVPRIIIIYPPHSVNNTLTQRHVKVIDKRIALDKMPNIIPINTVKLLYVPTNTIINNARIHMPYHILTQPHTRLYITKQRMHQLPLRRCRLMFQIYLYLIHITHIPPIIPYTPLNVKPPPLCILSNHTLYIHTIPSRPSPHRASIMPPPP
jgi:hypothetical protein